jgi:hypothetical protein
MKGNGGGMVSKGLRTSNLLIYHPKLMRVI